MTKMTLSGATGASGAVATTTVNIRALRIGLNGASDALPSTRPRTFSLLVKNMQASTVTYQCRSIAKTCHLSVWPRVRKYVL